MAAPQPLALRFGVQGAPTVGKQREQPHAGDLHNENHLKPTHATRQDHQEPKSLPEQQGRHQTLVTRPSHITNGKIRSTQEWKGGDESVRRVHTETGSSILRSETTCLRTEDS